MMLGSSSGRNCLSDVEISYWADQSVRYILIEHWSVCPLRDVYGALVLLIVAGAYFIHPRRAMGFEENA